VEAGDIIDVDHAAGLALGDAGGWSGIFATERVFLGATAASRRFRDADDATLRDGRPKLAAAFPPPSRPSANLENIGARPPPLFEDCARGVGIARALDRLIRGLRGVRSFLFPSAVGIRQRSAFDPAGIDDARVFFFFSARRLTSKLDFRRLPG